MRKLLFRSRSGEGYPMVIAVTLCLLMLFMVIAEYFRVNNIVQGVRDAVQQAVIATVNENYDEMCKKRTFRHTSAPADLKNVKIDFEQLKLFD